jgi:hypothetical protein
MDTFIELLCSPKWALFLAGPILLAIALRGCDATSCGPQPRRT